MKPTLLLPIALLLFTSGCPFMGPGGSTPEPDDCTSPRALDGIESIEIGHTEDGAFVPWEDGAAVALTYGPQGGTMLGVVLSVRGRDLPQCMEQRMTLSTAEFPELSTDYSAVNTYPDVDGTRITRPIWLILYGPEPLPGESVDLTLTVGDIELHRTLEIL